MVRILKREFSGSSLKPLKPKTYFSSRGFTFLFFKGFGFNAKIRALNFSPDEAFAMDNYQICVEKQSTKTCFSLQLKQTRFRS